MTRHARFSCVLVQESDARVRDVRDVRARNGAACVQARAPHPRPLLLARSPAPERVPRRRRHGHCPTA
jgi:hypothetical protein